MDRKRHYKLPIIEKYVKSPLSDLKPGVYLPQFRLYGLDKKTQETTITCYNETDYVERKKNTQKEFKLGCEVQLSECSPKVINLRHQGQRRLQQTLTDLTKQSFLTLKENDILRAKIEHENKMKVQRTTISLSNLMIPGWRYREDVCKCYQCDTKSCPVHWAKLDDMKEDIPKPPSILVQRKISVIARCGGKGQFNSHFTHENSDSGSSSYTNDSVESFDDVFNEDIKYQQKNHHKKGLIKQNNSSHHVKLIPQSKTTLEKTKYRKDSDKDGEVFFEKKTKKPHTGARGPIKYRRPIRPNTGNGYRTSTKVSNTSQRLSRPKTAI